MAEPYSGPNTPFTIEGLLPSTPEGAYYGVANTTSDINFTVNLEYIQSTYDMPAPSKLATYYYTVTDGASGNIVFTSQEKTGFNGASDVINIGNIFGNVPDRVTATNVYIIQYYLYYIDESGGISNSSFGFDDGLVGRGSGGESDPEPGGAGQ